MTRCRRVGMADEADSKSVVGNHVRVQVPLPALSESLRTSRIKGLKRFFVFQRLFVLYASLGVNFGMSISVMTEFSNMKRNKSIAYAIRLKMIDKIVKYFIILWTGNREIRLFNHIKSHRSKRAGSRNYVLG